MALSPIPWPKAVQQEILEMMAHCGHSPLRWRRIVVLAPGHQSGVVKAIMGMVWQSAAEWPGVALAQGEVAGLENQ